MKEQVQAVLPADKSEQVNSRPLLSIVTPAYNEANNLPLLYERLSQVMDTIGGDWEWIEENIPPGSRIVMDSEKYHLGVYGPSLRLSRWTPEQFVAGAESLNGTPLARREGTRRVSYSGEAEYFRQQLQTLDAQPGYDVIQILHDVGLPRADVLTLDEYLSIGVKYAIVSSYTWKEYVPGSETAVRYPDKAAKYGKFYQALEARATLLKEFSPSDQMGGPILRLYKLPIP